MPWFDVGVNLLDPRFNLETELQACQQADVSDVLIIASDIAESSKAAELVKSTIDISVRLHATAGIHPHHADHASAESWTQLRRLIADKTICAIGECGLDFNRNFSSQENQIAAFEMQLSIAKEHNMGVYLHERDAFRQQMDMLAPVVCDLPFAVAHCFTGTREQMQAYLDLGCMIGVTGWVCDDKRGQSLQDAVKYLPLERLLLETDAPYLFPKTHKPRAKHNSSRYIYAIADKVAEIKSLPVQVIQQASFDNACRVFS